MSGALGRSATPGPLGRLSDGVKRFELARLSGNAAVAAGAFRVYNDTGEDLTITQARVSVGTAPTGATLIVDVNLNGTTIFTTQASRPAIAISAFTAVNSATPDVTTWPNGSYLTADVDQVGSSVTGANLTVEVVTSPVTPA